MLTLLLSLLLHLVQIDGLPEGMPGRDDSPQYVKPASSMAPKYFDMLEQNSHIVYPALAGLTLLLVVVGIFQAWKSQDMDGLTKNEFKRAIVNELRRNLSGLPGDMIARAIGLDRLKTVKLLEQMQQEGMVNSYMSSSQMMMWRVRGAGPEKKDQRY
ncbi:hypothetical protein [Hyalangium minutum]|uniref:Uncharacterized protein n=1 Tax=Hyalangium minutum TaxID=394096 RepID=A0A085W036_9BACT|nr:hypothetical protein [Hyalangium minutum]KFE61049.1 hypothetical protein DB31_4484 [Hyalangium minutum]